MKISSLAATGLFLALAATTQAREVVQIDVTELFNNRPITIVEKSNVVPMTGDVDGAGGMITYLASKMSFYEDARSLPDDGLFPANNHHPLIILPYGKAGSKAPQARKSVGEDTFSFPVPPKNYSRLWLVMTSGEGATTIHVTLDYADGTADERTLEVPDWYWELKSGETYRCYVGKNLSKWSPEKQLEKDHHFLFGIDIQPNREKTLEKVTVEKTKPGILGFFGATGQVGDPD